ncbi:MAG TPA: hypothetical protein DCY03_28295, partial [Planctomycetaceae bacterium]|nr:hypothetical protein [Planctomycetaceae bacterium]
TFLSIENWKKIPGIKPDRQAFALKPENRALLPRFPLTKQIRLDRLTPIETLLYLRRARVQFFFN